MDEVSLYHLSQPVATGESQRIVFANQLRGLAALSVMVSHWLIVFWALPDQVAATAAAPPVPGPAPAGWDILYRTWFNPGPLGVAVFFLISGFVIPFSLQRNSASSFLAARVLRIFPTYAVGLGVSVLLIGLSARYWGRPNWVTVSDYLANAALVNELGGWPGIDLVNWTLEIEIKFYVVVALLSVWVRQGRVAPLAGYAAATLVVLYGLLRACPGAGHACYGRSVPFLAYESVCLIYLFIGTVFHFRLRGQISVVRATLTIAVLFILFCLGWKAWPMMGPFPGITANYLWGLLLFWACFVLRARFRPHRLLDAMAAISYPLYVVHALIGYVVIRIGIDLGLGYAASFLIAFALAIVMATALHLLVERPMMRAGRRFARAPDPRSRSMGRTRQAAVL